MKYLVIAAIIALTAITFVEIKANAIDIDESDDLVQRGGVLTIPLEDCLTRRNGSRRITTVYPVHPVRGGPRTPGYWVGGRRGQLRNLSNTANCDREARSNTESKFRQTLYSRNQRNICRAQCFLRHIPLGALSSGCPVNGTCTCYKANGNNININFY